MHARGMVSMYACVHVYLWAGVHVCVWAGVHNTEILLDPILVLLILHRIVKLVRLVVDPDLLQMLDKLSLV